MLAPELTRAYNTSDEARSAALAASAAMPGVHTYVGCNRIGYCVRTCDAVYAVNLNTVFLYGVELVQDDLPF